MRIDIADTEYVFKVVTVRLSEIEIPRFKQSRVDRFSSVMESYSNSGMECVDMVRDI
jgi:hypothetical protein